MAFRFGIGKVLVHKAARNEPNAQRFIVIARLTEECMGGTQELYITRGVTTQGFSMTGAVTMADIKFFEFELEESKEK